MHIGYQTIQKSLKIMQPVQHFVLFCPPTYLLGDIFDRSLAEAVRGIALSSDISSAVYSYNSIKRICSIKRPGLEFFKNILLSVPYHR